MPKLPDDSVLGGLPSANSGRPIASYDVTGYARGAAAEAQGVKDLGQGVQALANAGISYAQDKTSKADDLNRARSKAGWLVDKTKLDDERDSETDPEALNTYKDRYKQAAEKAAALIQNPVDREKFMLERAPEIEAAHVKATDNQYELNKTQSIADTNDELAKLQSAGATARDPATRAEAVKTGQALIEKLEENGYIDAAQAQKLKQGWAQGYAVKAIEAMPPGQRLAALGVGAGGFEGSLVGSESSGNPRAHNDSGYVGLYQFGAPRLQTLGLYTPGGGSGGWQAWNGTFNIPGFPTVKTLDDFKNNPDAQRAAFGAHIADFDKQIEERGLDQYIGKTVGGIPITKTAIYGMAHLGGISGAERFLESGGKINPADSNGTRLSDYAARFGKTNPSLQLASIIPPDQRAQLAQGATREIVLADRQQQQAQQAEIATVKSLIQDDRESIIATGKPVAAVTPERVTAALGPAAAAELQDDRRRAQAFHDETHDWENVPVAKIGESLGRLKPADGEPGYVAQRSYYDAAYKKALAIQKQRSEDPAGAVERLPEVQQAHSSAALDPSAFPQVAKARLQAQARIGIPETGRSPITQAEAKAFAAPLQQVMPGQERATIEGIVKQVRAQFGPYSDQALASILAEQGVDKAITEQAAALFRKVGISQPLTPEEARAFDEAQKTAAAAKAVKGIATPSDPGRGWAYNVDPKTGAVATPESSLQQAPASSPTFPTPDEQAVKMLRADPRLAPKFDAVYGEGTSKKVLAVAKPAAKEAAPAPTMTGSGPTLPDAAAAPPKKRTVKILRGEDGALSGLSIE